MSCEEWLPLVLQAAESHLDDLDVAERRRLETHLADCAGCRSALEDQRIVRETLTARADAAVPPGFADRIVSRVTPGLRWVDVLSWRIWTYRLAPVATGLLLFSLLTPSGTAEADLPVGLPDLAEAWAFGGDVSPSFAVWGYEDVSGEVLLDVVLSAEPDEPTHGGGFTMTNTATRLWVAAFVVLVFVSGLSIGLAVSAWLGAGDPGNRFRGPGRTGFRTWTTGSRVRTDHRSTRG